MNKLFYFSMAILATLVFPTARAAPDPLDTINININDQNEQPPPPLPKPAPRCICINPWGGSQDSRYGDPARLCRMKGMCYVSCNNGCRDEEATAGGAPARCQSRMACDDNVLPKEKEQPPPPPESAPSWCICINPWPGSLIGDPDRLCRTKGMCYVTCNLACRDEQVAGGVGRCQSRVACDGGVLPKEKERGLSRESPKIFPAFQETRKGNRFQGSPPFLDSDYLSPGPMCTCENPWANTPNWLNGDPALLCRQKGMCYVDCNYGCRDQEATAAGAPARCESKVACEVLKGKKREEK